MNEEAKKEWERFHSGHWTKSQPQHVGYYIVASNDGSGSYDICATPVYIYELGAKFLSVQSWGGLWWSERLPEAYALPRPVTRKVIELHERGTGTPTGVFVDGFEMVEGDRYGCVVLDEDAKNGFYVARPNRWVGTCVVCGKPQYETPSGPTCGDHGGAPSKED